MVTVGLAKLPADAVGGQRQAFAADIAAPQRQQLLLRITEIAALAAGEHLQIAGKHAPVLIDQFAVAGKFFINDG